MAGTFGSEGTVYRAWESLGEWIHRIVQWEVERRAVESGDLHDTNRSEGID